MNEPAALRAPALALYGGTFDPIHAGHLAVASAALDHAKLDAVVFVPAHQSPHKLATRPTADADRLALVRTALSSEPRFDCWTIELERAGPSFTIDTVLAARKCRGVGGHELALVIGSDSLAGLPRWKRINEVLELVRPIVVPRVELAIVRAQLDELSAHFAAPLHARLVAGLVLLREPHPASATQLRAELEHGRCPPGWLPDDVLALVRERGLYGYASQPRGGQP